MLSMDNKKVMREGGGIIFSILTNFKNIKNKFLIYESWIEGKIEIK
jgi:hypothetical protein